ncbi:MAG: hypothetical protein L0215_15950 [Gemmataceae bacterium]|nr:hypothetical protein [Gemmataceae bacterium]
MATTKTAARASNARPQAPSKSSDEVDMGRDLVEYLKEYAREKPEVAALWCFGIGFILGWKLKPW